jgi:hypothetical protein
MLSQSSGAALTQLFQEAVRTSLVRSAEQQLEISAVDADIMGDSPRDDVVLITISSYSFRLLVFLHCADSTANRAYFLGDGKAKDLRATFAELANLCCGAVNRLLAPSCSCLGMSIPSWLSARHLEFLGELKPQYLSGYTIRIDDSVQLLATLCMCCTAPIEISALPPGSQEEEAALEMF